MGRQAIYEHDEVEGTRLVGHFDPDRATKISEGKRWDGQNMRGRVSGLQFGGAVLYRTAAGRWVENHDASNEFHGPDLWRFLTDDEAREWLIKAEHPEAEAALAEHFDVPAEAGPNVGGRPEIGPAIAVKYPAELLARIDAAAADADLSRAAWLRRAAERLLAAR